MQGVWCPETASKAYIDVVKAVTDRDLPETDVAEYVAALAGGRKAQLIVEAWHPDGGVATSFGLLAAASHAQGCYVCVVPDKQSATEYVEAMLRAGAPSNAAELVVVGDAEEVMRELEGVDLIVVDCRRRDEGKLLTAARPATEGMVVVCKGVASRRVGAAALKVAGSIVVRSKFLPIGNGIEVLHVDPCLCGSGRARYIRRSTNEEHVLRR